MEGLEVHRGEVLPAWIDYNEHMNVAYYVLAFDLAVDGLWAKLGMTEEHRRESGDSTFAVECHVRYLSELKENEPFAVTAQLLAWDAKRIHHFQRMYHPETGVLVATCEWMNLHVDLERRKVSPWPEFVLEALAKIAAVQRDLERPAEAGRAIRVPDPLGP